jgi:hypothetical protein
LSEWLGRTRHGAGYECQYEDNNEEGEDDTYGSEYGLEPSPARVRLAEATDDEGLL